MDGQDKALESTLAKALGCAQKGEVSSMESALHDVRIYAWNWGIVGGLPEIMIKRIAEIKHIGYPRGVERELEKALQYAREGKVSSVHAVLYLAKRYAGLARVDITKRVGEIYLVGYPRGVERELEKALQCAQEGNFVAMKDGLEHASRYASHAGLNIDGRIAEVKSALKK